MVWRDTRCESIDRFGADNEDAAYNYLVAIVGLESNPEGVRAADPGRSDRARPTPRTPGGAIGTRPGSAPGTPSRPGAPGRLSPHSPPNRSRLTRTALARRTISKKTWIPLSQGREGLEVGFWPDAAIG